MRYAELVRAVDPSATDPEAVMEVSLRCPPERFLLRFRSIYPTNILLAGRVKRLLYTSVRLDTENSSYQETAESSKTRRSDYPRLSLRVRFQNSINAFRNAIRILLYRL